MNIIDLFAGGGGLSEGFRQKEFNIIAHVEMDKQASLTLKTREIFHYLKEKKQLNLYMEYLKKGITQKELYNLVPSKLIDKVINKEITHNTLQEIFDKIDELLKGTKVDMIIGGPPCQAYSLAGRSRDPRKMEDDPRNYLYKHYISFLKKYRPSYFLFENVTGILSAKKGTIFDGIRNEMEEIGYKVDFRILNSKNFGVLQSRKRVIIIGWVSKIEFKYPEFKPSEDPTATIWDLFSDLPSLEAGENLPPGYFYDSKPNNYNVKSGIRDVNWSLLTQHEARPHRKIDKRIYEHCVKKWNREKRRVKYNELPKELITHKNTTTFLDRFKVVPYEGISHTLVAHISKDGHYYIHPDVLQNRSISIREAARIQSFPDNYYFEGPRTSVFKQIGNSVPPLMAKAIGDHFKKITQTVI